MEMIRPTPDHQHLALLQSDLEMAAQRQDRQRDAAQFALDRLGELLNQADVSLTKLENDPLALGSAIVRGCQDLADAVGHLATQIDQQSDDERRALAQACIDDAQQSLLFQEDEGVAPLSASDQSHLVELSSNLSEDQVASAIQAAGSLLRDVESTLRAIDRHDADEIADVALTVAHLFVMSLQSVHETLAPEDLTEPSATTALGAVRTGPQSTTTIEILDDSDGGDGEGDDAFSSVHGSASRTTNPRDSKSTSRQRRRRMDRLRVLWPPLGPHVSGALGWGKEAASQKPLLAVALGMTLWPVAVLTTVIGGPVVLADRLLQDLYQNFSDGPVIEGLELSAAQLYHTGRLSLLCGRLLGRQTLRVVNRQVERHGGVGKIAHDLGGMAVDRVSHPIETVSMAWGGISWGVGVALDAWNQVKEKEQSDIVQRLQT